VERLPRREVGKLAPYRLYPSGNRGLEKKKNGEGEILLQEKEKRRPVWVCLQEGEEKMCPLRGKTKKGERTEMNMVKGRNEKKNGERPYAFVHLVFSGKGVKVKKGVACVESITRKE